MKPQNTFSPSAGQPGRAAFNRHGRLFPAFRAQAFLCVLGVAVTTAMPATADTKTLWSERAAIEAEQTQAEELRKTCAQNVEDLRQLSHTSAMAPHAIQARVKDLETQTIPNVRRTEASERRDVEIAQEVYKVRFPAIADAARTFDSWAAFQSRSVQERERILARMATLGISSEADQTLRLRLQLELELLPTEGVGSRPGLSYSHFDIHFQRQQEELQKFEQGLKDFERQLNVIRPLARMDQVQLSRTHRETQGRLKEAEEAYRQASERLAGVMRRRNTLIQSYWKASNGAEQLFQALATAAGTNHRFAPTSGVNVASGINVESFLFKIEGTMYSARSIDRKLWMEVQRRDTHLGWPAPIHHLNEAGCVRHDPTAGTTIMYRASDSRWTRVVQAGDIFITVAGYPTEAEASAVKGDFGALKEITPWLFPGYVPKGNAAGAEPPPGNAAAQRPDNPGRNCAQCGKAATPSAKFCTHCGGKLATLPTPASATPTSSSTTQSGSPANPATTKPVIGIIDLTPPTVIDR